MEYMLELKERMGVSEADISDRSQFNLALLKLKRDFGVLNTGRDGSVSEQSALLTDEATLTRIDAFVKEVSKIGNPGDEAQVTLNRLKDARNKAGRLPSAFATFVDSQTALVTYKDTTIYFQKIASDGTNPSFYMGTIECPVGLVCDVINAAHLPAEKTESLLDCATPGQGPCGWKWMDSTSSMSLSMSWLEANPTAAVGHDSELPSITKWSPMQYVTPQAAQYVARQLGCRLPTQEEWIRASKHTDGKASPSLLRGAAFQEYLKDYRGAVGSPSDLGPFVDGFFVGDVGNVTNQTGQLWFHSEPQDAKTLQNMIGNVAEWAYDGAPDKVIEPGDLTKVHIMGRSIISDPQNAPQTNTPSKDKGPLPKYEDVGFRMAFEDPSGIAGREIRSEVKSDAFLQPPGRDEGK
jgi:hypothetical protein